MAVPLNCCTRSDGAFIGHKEQSMNVVFIGGGSFRTLPIVRAAMSDGVTLRNGTIWLVDLNLDRAETVGRLIMRTPEFAGSACQVRWSTDLDEALPGADMVSVSFPVGSSQVCQLSEEASHQHGFHGSDQLSVSGAFRSLTGGVIMLDIARRMEKHCPGAWLVDHANPVAVYSGLVNNHTRIHALGLCGSCYHPRWDLTRLLYEVDEYRKDYTYVEAGVNHLTFLLRCEHKGQDVYTLLDKKYGDQPWTPRLMTVSAQTLRTLHFSYHLLRKMRRSFGVMACSNELEGPRHLFSDEYPALPEPTEHYKDCISSLPAVQPDEIRRNADLAFKAHLDRELNAAFWARPCRENPHFGANHEDLTAVVLQALGSGTPQWLGASHPNRGAVKGFKDRMVLEYSFTFDRNGIHPDRDLEVPDCYHGLISALSAHQTLLGDAIATGDPQLFAEALFAYPHQQSMENARALWNALLTIHAAEIPEVFQRAKEYFA